MRWVLGWGWGLWRSSTSLVSFDSEHVLNRGQWGCGRSHSTDRTADGPTPELHRS